MVGDEKANPGCERADRDEDEDEDASPKQAVIAAVPGITPGSRLDQANILRSVTSLASRTVRGSAEYAALPRIDELPSPGKL